MTDSGAVLAHLDVLRRIEERLRALEARPAPTDLSSLVTDHGQLSGLADDDHPQYATIVEVDSAVATGVAPVAAAVAAETVARAVADDDLELAVIMRAYG